MTRRILVAPAGKRFSPEAGSEDGWIYDIVSGVATIEPEFRFTCIAEKADGFEPATVDTVQIGYRRTEELGGLMLPFRNGRAAARLAPLGTVDLVHHALPFAVGRSFSLLVYQAHQRGIPVVIGPVQTPLEWTGRDELGGQLDHRDLRRVRRAATVLAKAAAPAAEGVLAALSADALRRADRVVVVSQAAQALVESAGVDPGRVEIIPPPTRMPGCPVTGRELRSGPLRLLTAGYLIDRKGVGDLFRVVADLASAGEDVVLDVAGDGPAGPGLWRQARQHQGGDVIQRHGWVERSKMGDLFKSADAYVSMSRGESWGQALADALAYSLVAISAANIGAQAMAALGAPIRLVPIGDLNGLTHELRRLCRLDRVSLAAEGAVASRWAAKNVAASVVAERWAALYHRAMEQSDGRRGRE